ncbi:hypothetical protein E4U41_006025 [Claviceps citrina]|nr:hypothetical protein E4U41_006025 [Claviceps citrina]
MGETMSFGTASGQWFSRRACEDERNGESLDDDGDKGDEGDNGDDGDDASRRTHMRSASGRCAW